MLRTLLASVFRAALTQLVEQGRLPQEVLDVRIEIADPKNPEHGDFACNIAMVASKVAGKNPREFAEMLIEVLPVSHLSDGRGGRGVREEGLAAAALTPKSPLPSQIGEGTSGVFEKIEIAGPGFINLTLNAEYVASYVGLINMLGQGDLAKQSPVENPLKINVEFVSVNPNGPITIGSGRGAAYGSTLCNIFEAAGHTVHREYYINDGVNSEQMRLFAESVRALVNNLPVPLNGYKGDYVKEVATLAMNDHPIWDQTAEAMAEDFKTRWDIFKPTYEAVKSKIEQLSDKTRELLANKVEITSPDGMEYFLNVENHLAALRQAEQEREAIERVRSELKVVYNAMQTADELESEAFRTVILLTHHAIGSFRVHLPVSAFQAFAQSAMLDQQRTALAAFGVTFDTWFSEQSLHDSGVVAAEIDSLAAKGIANTEPTRTKLKLAKGGKIEDVIIESQTAEVDEEGEKEIPLAGEGSVSKGEPGEWAASSQSSDRTPTSSPELTDSLAREGDQHTLWLRSTKLGDDMDRVLLRKDGRLTYIASDVAYHKDKFNRPLNADKLITILGPDHHGYIGRLTAVVAAMLLEPSEPGEPCPDEFDAKLYRDENEKAACQKALKEAREKLEVQIYQLVRFMKDGKPAPMRKRDGNIYALIDLMREIGTKLKPEGTEAEQLESGKDVARFFYLMRSHDTTFDFDLDLAEKQSDENPVFYVQYAHARICSILEKAGQQGDVNLALLTHPKEKTLIKRIADLPNEVSRAAEDYGVHRLTTYAIELARAFHGFYGDCKVISEDAALTAARVQLCEATKKALKETLDLLGVSAPERM